MQRQTKAFPLLAILLTLSLAGCQDSSSTRTFAGFTFGGGGNTFSCEPATWTAGESGFQLSAGQAGDTTAIRLTGKGPVKASETTQLSEASLTVPGYEGPASLVEGTLVQQHQDGPLAHGSFDLKAKTPDGREFSVVGSYTASVEGAR